MGYAEFMPGILRASAVLDFSLGWLTEPLVGLRAQLGGSGAETGCRSRATGYRWRTRTASGEKGIFGLESGWFVPCILTFRQLYPHTQPPSNRNEIMVRTSDSPISTEDAHFPIYDVTSHDHGRDLDLRTLRYLEVGVLHGGASLIVARAMDALGHDGRLVLIDKTPQVNPGDWEVLEPRSVLIAEPSPQALQTARRASGGAFDFAFIDAGHRTEDVLRDAGATLPFMATGGYMLFHDG